MTGAPNDEIRISPRRTDSPDHIESHMSTDQDGTVLCTFVPADASGSDLMTAWITAGDGTFVDLAEMV